MHPYLIKTLHELEIEESFYSFMHLELQLK